MAAVLCAECNWPVSPSAAECGRCRAPIWVADPPPPPPDPPPPASYRGLVVTGGSVVALTVAVLAYAGKNTGGTLTDLALHGPSFVPETRRLVGETIRVPSCRHDWRACADNGDWARNGDRAGPQGACLRVAEGASRLGHFAWDRPGNAPRFDSYLRGTSIREGYIVFADHGALVRDVSGGWARTSLHCTFDFVAGRVRSIAQP